MRWLTNVSSRRGNVILLSLLGQSLNGEQILDKTAPKLSLTNALDAAKDTEEKYQTYYDRVQVESLFYRYMLLKNYNMEFSKEELSTMVDEFETYARIGNLTQLDNKGKNGAKQVESFIAEIRAKLG